MFVPEISTESGFVLVHNHDLQTRAAVDLSARFTAARVVNARLHADPDHTTSEIIFDVRAQIIHADAKAALSARMLDVASVSFKQD